MEYDIRRMASMTLLYCIIILDICIQDNRATDLVEPSNYHQTFGHAACRAET